MFGFNKKNNKNNEFLIPVSGTVIDLEQVPDQVFSQKLMGDGFAIDPTSNDVYAPISGTIVSMFPHAFGIQGDDGLEVLVHIGIDSVNLDGEGFTLHKNQGDRVKAGDLIVTADFVYLKDHIPSIVTPVIFTSADAPSFNINNREVSALDADAITLN